jgi:hypothetical protein
MAKTGKGAKETANYTKWKDSGYLDGLDETAATPIAEYLEASDTAMKLQGDVNSHAVTTQQGDIDFNKLEIGLEIVVDLYQEKGNPLIVIDFDDLYDDLKLAISQRGVNMFGSTQVSSDGSSYFDSTNLECFKEWFLNSYSEKKGK